LTSFASSLNFSAAALDTRFLIASPQKLLLERCLGSTADDTSGGLGEIEERLKQS